MSKVTDMTKEELLSSLGEHIKEVVFRYKDVWENYENLDEENKELKQEILKSTETYDLGFEEGFAKGEESMQEKAKKIVDFWVETDMEEIGDVFRDIEAYEDAFDDINESYDKIIAYEKKKEQEAEIHVGDEVADEDGEKYIVRCLQPERVFALSSKRRNPNKNRKVRTRR